MGAGLLPFCAGAIAMRAGWPALPLIGPLEPWYSAYGLVIAAFMAGTLWGRAAPAGPGERGFLLLLSNMVALALWVGAVMLRGPAFDLLLSGAFAILLLADLRLTGPAAYPPGYRRLRIAVTGLVILSLLLHAAP
jgi:hypothetical protein